MQWLQMIMCIDFSGSGRSDHGGGRFAQVRGKMPLWSILYFIIF